MTPGARVQAAIEALDVVLGGMPAEQALTRWARGARYAGSKDRAAVRDHVFQALRCRRSYAALGGAGHVPTGRTLMIGALRDEGTDPDLLFNGEGHAPTPLTGAERSGGGAAESEAARRDLPDWLWEEFSTSLGAEASDAADRLRQRAPITLRVDLGVNSRAETIEILQKDGIEAKVSDIAPTALIVTTGERRIAGSTAYRDGLVELQDGSSQAATLRLHLSGARVLDYCAGGGGKALALAARARAEGRNTKVFAHDADPGRMRDLPARAERAGLSITRLGPGELPNHAPYDLILCDVPCSGSGTWRRAPDAKWRLSPDDLKALERVQALILAEAAALVAPGGQLAYTTCSVLRAENEEQSSAFLSSHPDWGQLEEHRWPISAEGDGFYFSLIEHRQAQ